MFKVGDKVRIAEPYFDDLDNDFVEQGRLRELTGVVLTAEHNDWKGFAVYDVQFKDAPYFKDYWIMYGDEIELVEDEEK